MKSKFFLRTGQLRNRERSKCSTCRSRDLITPTRIRRNHIDSIYNTRSLVDSRVCAVARRALYGIRFRSKNCSHLIATQQLYATCFAKVRICAVSASCLFLEDDFARVRCAEAFCGADSTVGIGFVVRAASLNGAVVGGAVIFLASLNVSHCDFTGISWLPVAAVGVRGLRTHLCKFRSIHLLPFSATSDFKKKADPTTAVHTGVRKSGLKLNH
jgi:hypothetical protein